MKLTSLIKCNTDYSRNLLCAAWDGARSAQETAFDGPAMGRLVAKTTVNSFGLAMMGAIAGGAAGARIRTKQHSESDAAVSGALIGAAFGLSTGLLWNTRPWTGAVMRGAKKSVEAVRDANWLARNPINFG